VHNFPQENLEWVHKGRSGGFGLVLKHGEASRAIHALVQGYVNWCLYVLSKLQDPPAGPQLYPDRGPKVRSKGKGGKGKAAGKAGQKGGKGGGKGYGKRGGKGKGKGKDKGGLADMQVDS
jgi:hypothetical protein